MTDAHIVSTSKVKVSSCHFVWLSVLIFEQSQWVDSHLVGRALTSSSSWPHGTAPEAHVSSTAACMPRLEKGQ